MLKILFIIILLFPFNIKAFQTSASASILMDIKTHQILYGHNIDLKRPVASISKIMTT